MDALLRECNVGQTVLIKWHVDSEEAVWEAKVLEYAPDTKKLKLEFTYDKVIYTYLPHELTKEHMEIFENEQIVEDENLPLLFG